MAEQAFEMQLETTAAGDLSNLNMEQLKVVQKKLGLSDDCADKIIKKLHTRIVLGSLQQLKVNGELGLDRLLEVSKKGIDLDSFISNETRLQIFRGEVARAMSDGTGKFDNEKFL